jgi:nicotinate-nucleotide adenylyltransferase
LDVDETWMLFSQNPDKDPSVYASLEHRINMADILARDAEVPIVMSDAEAKIAERIGRCETYFILEEMQKQFPSYKFIFVMGADSFSKFHTWKERDDILDKYCVAVVNRPGYTQAALESPTAYEFAQLAVDVTQATTLKDKEMGWCFLDNPLIDMSSSGIVQKLTQGEGNFDTDYADVIEYIDRHGLYQSSCPGASARSVEHFKCQ